METVQISKKEYERLLKVDAHMDELQARGVDNWGEYVGDCQYCDECNTDDISWSETKCPSCGEKLDDGW